MKVSNNNDILYLVSKETDNSFVRQMVEKCLVLVDEPLTSPYFEITSKGNELFFHTRLDNKPILVGGFSLPVLWNKLVRQRGAVKKEPLAKAIGLKNIKENKMVVDMSCGTGKDSLLLLSFGANVHAFERDRIIYIILYFYFLQLKTLDNFPKERFILSEGSPHDFNFDNVPAVIYFDPMYSENANKKAAPRKHMAIFRDFVGLDHDYLEHLKYALNVASNRVVLKRPLKSEVIFPDLISHSIKGKSTRYDVYLTKPD